MEILLVIGAGILIYLVSLKKNKTPSLDLKNNSKTRACSDEKIDLFSSNNKILPSYDEDVFASFTLSYCEEEETKNNVIGRWITPEESITVNGELITKGYFYYGGQLNAYESDSSYFNHQSTEASLVDNTLTIQKTKKEYQDETLGYWPKFISLSPKCRGAYVDWLASERMDPNTPMGYVFIYFYGLERRILVDNSKGEVSDTEFKNIFEEIKRLHKVFIFNHSFRGYSRRFISLMSFIRPEIVTALNDDPSFSNDSLLFKFELATKISEGKPIPPDLALLWIMSSPDYSFRTPARRCEFEFSQLFKKCYSEKFGDGLKVKPNKTKLKLEYNSASSTLRGFEIEQKDLPDPRILKAPVKKLIIIADECSAQLEAYSRYLGKKGTSKEDIYALLLLPDGVTNSASLNVIPQLKSWIDEEIIKNKGLVLVSDFWTHTGIALPEKINKKDIELIQQLTKKAGYGFAPDPRYHHAKLLCDGNMVLFEGGHGDYFSPSLAFNDMGMVLRLGAMVAQIDSRVDESEIHVLKQLIDHDIQLSPVEKSSLQAYLIWRLNSPSNMSGLKGQIEKLGDEEKGLMSHILVGVALADGKICAAEIKQLEKIYLTLGLDKSLLSNDIHQCSISKKTKQQMLASKGNLTNTSGFSLDEDILALHESETKDVQKMLGAIFANDEPEDLLEKPSSETVNVLDKAHFSLFNALIERHQWSRDEALELCKMHNLMLDGALETINDWSFEKVDAPVLDDADDVYVDHEIVAELKG